MAIRDLLWACPVCGAEGGVRTSEGRDACVACGTRYRRGRGAAIVAEMPGGETVERPAADWVDRLPAIEETSRFADETPGSGPLHRERARARFAAGQSIVRHAAVFMNRIERFGRPRDGELVLERDRLRFQPDDGAAEAWTFDDITAVQPSSSTLQIKARGRPVVSFRFPNGSARFWEELIAAAVQRHYHATGRGTIVEFQPRIVTR